MKLLTNLIFEPKGRHDPALDYNIMDVVMSADGSRAYFAVQDVPAGTALDDEDYWKLQIDLSGMNNGPNSGPVNITINGEGPDENGNFVINTLNDVEIAQLRAVIT